MRSDCCISTPQEGFMLERSCVMLMGCIAKALERC